MRLMLDGSRMHVVRCLAAIHVAASRFAGAQAGLLERGPGLIAGALLIALILLAGGCATLVGK